MLRRRFRQIPTVPRALTAGLAVLLLVAAGAGAEPPGLVSNQAPSPAGGSVVALDPATGDGPPLGPSPGSVGVMLTYFDFNMVVLEGLDLATGEIAPLQDLEIPGVILNDSLALDFGPDGRLFAVEGSTPVGLIEIDPVAGTVKTTGILGVSIVINDMAIDACGRIWLASEALDDPHALWQVDPVTGEAELRGAFPERITGLAAAGETLYGIAQNYGVEEPRIVRIDTETAELTDVAVIEGQTFLHTRAMDFVSEDELVILGFSETFYPIVRVDLAGEATMGPATESRFNLAIAPPTGRCVSGSPLPIPAASPVGLIGLALLLAAAGAWIAARQARAQSSSGDAA